MTKPALFVLVVVGALGCGEAGYTPDAGRMALPGITDLCGNSEMHKDKALPGLVGPATPVYTRDVGLVRVESYQHDPTQPPTPVSPQHLTLLTNELCHLVEELGETLDEENDTQLETAFEQSKIGGEDFLVVLTDINNVALSNITYSGNNLATFIRVGRWVHVEFRAEWTNTDAGQATLPVILRMPFDAQTVGTIYTGSLNYRHSDFNTANQTTGFYHVELQEGASTRNAQIYHATQPGTATAVAIGDNELRKVVGSLTIRHNGTRR